MKVKIILLILSILQIAAISMLIIGINNVAIIPHNIGVSYAITSIVSVWLAQFSLLFYAYLRRIGGLFRIKLRILLAYSIASLSLFVVTNTIKAVDISDSLWWVVFIYLLLASVGYLTFLLASMRMPEKSALILSIAMPIVIAGILIILFAWVGICLLANSSQSKSSSNSGGGGQTSDNHAYVHTENDFSVSLLNGPTLTKNYQGKWFDSNGKEWVRDTAFGTNGFRRK